MTGRRRRLSQTVYGTKADAERVLTKLLAQRDDGVLLHRSRETLGAWLDEFAREWSGHLAPQTRENAAQALRCYLPPGLLDLRLPDLRPSHLQALYNAMERRGLAPATVSHLHRVLHTRLAKAVELELLGTNPAAVARPPATRRREYRVLAPAEARIFLDEAGRDTHGALWVLLLLLGLRPGEALALRWSDLGGNRLAVRRSLARLAGGRCDFGETKTRRARTVSLPPGVLGALQRHRVRQAEARLLLGGEYVSQDLIFAGTFGQPLRWDNLVRRHFAPTLARTARRLQGRRVLGLPPTGLRRVTRRSWQRRWEALTARALEDTGLAEMRPYDLRHSAATLLLAAGEHPKVVAEILGHAKVALTLDTYSHVVPGLVEGAARRLEALVEDAPAPALRRPR